MSALSTLWSSSAHEPSLSAERNGLALHRCVIQHFAWILLKSLCSLGTKSDRRNERSNGWRGLFFFSLASPTDGKPKGISFVTINGKKSTSLSPSHSSPDASRPCSREQSKTRARHPRWMLCFGARFGGGMCEFFFCWLAYRRSRRAATPWLSKLSSRVNFSSRSPVPDAHRLLTYVSFCGHPHARHLFGSAWNR